MNNARKEFIMKNTKMMLTPKDIMYFNDVLDQIAVLKNRLAHEVTLLETEEIIQCFEDVQSQLLTSYDDLLSILKKEAKK